jgi:Ti-type conjugative transfer relaxase TraA
VAFYHFSVKTIGRSKGSKALAAAAYRAAVCLIDQRNGRAYDFSRKAGVVHSEILLPETAPAPLADRATLWNAVEAREVRKDAVLAREVEFAIPEELSQQQGIALVRDFTAQEFVARGMIADLNVHWDKAVDGSPRHHAHVMLSTRFVGPEGFGLKVCEWTKIKLLWEWRIAWAGHVNARLAKLDIDVRIDHRTLRAQGIALEPLHTLGPVQHSHERAGQFSKHAADHTRIARKNGDKIIADPSIALHAITHSQATFTLHDLAHFAFRHSDGKDQFDAVLASVRGSPELVALGKDGKDQERFTSRDMVAVEERLDRSAVAMSGTARHGVFDLHCFAALNAARHRGLILSDEQRDAFDHVIGQRDLALVVGYGGSGKSVMLGIARDAWERQGYRVRGASLSGIAAENLQNSSGIVSRTIASLEYQWKQDREQLGERDVLVIDEAGLTGTRQLERLLSTAHEAGAKVVLVGDPEQLQAIEAGAAFRSLAETHGAIEITEVRRQREDWQRAATRALATGRTGEAINAYGENGMVHAAETRKQARTELVREWGRARVVDPDKSRIILTHTNAEVRGLNIAAREKLREAGELGADVEVKTEHGNRMFATGDRVMFLRNQPSTGVKNGTLGTIEIISPQNMTVRTDDGRRVELDFEDYAHVDHGYAATFHKAQGVTVDQAHVLATPGLDRHSAYVGLSRHRDAVQLHFGRDDFADQGRLVRTLSRDRSKDMASDYAQPEAGARAFAERREFHFEDITQDMVDNQRATFADPDRNPVLRAELDRAPGPEISDLQNRGRGSHHPPRHDRDTNATEARLLARMAELGLRLQNDDDKDRDRARDREGMER